MYRALITSWFRRVGCHVSVVVVAAVASIAVLVIVARRIERAAADKNEAGISQPAAAKTEPVGSAETASADAAERRRYLEIAERCEEAATCRTGPRVAQALDDLYCLKLLGKKSAPEYRQFVNLLAEIRDGRDSLGPREAEQLRDIARNLREQVERPGKAKSGP
jgi:hypothetical protein